MMKRRAERLLQMWGYRREYHGSILDYVIECLVAPAMYAPSKWPTIPRRIFLLTFPIAVPLWLAYCVLIYIAAFVVWVALGIFLSAASMWYGIPKERL